MDPNGGNNPNPPKLDNAQFQQPDPNQQPTDIFTQPQSYDQPMSTGSIPQEMPASGPEMQDTYAQPPMPPSIEQNMGPMAPQAPQLQDPGLGYQQPIETDPMLNQPMMEPVAQSGGKKKLLVIIVAVILALAILSGIGFAAYTVGSSSARQKAAAEFQAQQAASQQSSDSAVDADTTEVQKDVTLDLSKTVQKSDVVEESLTGEIGKQIDSSDGLALYVTNIERGFTPDDPAYKVEDGKELIKINFIIGNFEDKAKDIKSSTLYLLEGEKAKVLPESRLTSYDGAFDTVKIESGQQTSVSIVYSVTKDVTPLTFVREQIYKLTQGSSESMVTSKISINLTS